MGVPPIHTPKEILAALPDEVKKKMLLVHASSKDIPSNCGLNQAKAGIINTIIL
jgi:hypothetical protein